MAKVYSELNERIKKPEGQFVFNNDKANYAIEFIERFCKHSKGEWAGKPVELELFQKAYISALFGFVDKDTGLRQYQESLLLVGRKNGKSTMLSAIALYMLVADHEAGSEVYSVATKKDQAKRVFEETYNMVQQSKDISEMVKKRKSDLYVPITFSKFEPLGKNSDSLDGLNSHLVIIDELHAIKDRNLYEVMKQSQSSRKQPLLVMITTAGTLRECIFDDMYSYACNVADGNFEDETFLPVLYELDKREEYKNPDLWVKANPGLGTIKRKSYIEKQLLKAKNSPRDLRGVLVKDFNIRDNVSETWLSFDQINNDETFNLYDFNGRYAIGGVDLSSTTDLTCATLLFMDKDSEKRYVHQMYWLPEEGFLERVESDKIPYDKWRDQGYLRLCEDNKINYGDITKWFIEMVKDSGIRVAWVYYDNWSAEYWAEEMREYGFDMNICRQGYKTLSAPMKNLGADLEAKLINYNNNPVLKWCLTNTAVKTDINGNIMPDRLNSKMKIDGTASLLDSYVGLMEHYSEFKEVQP
ncbi:terminase large subunit [Facklamia sp. P9177]